jgi:transcriptional regulator with XRE-family HTH domain
MMSLWAGGKMTLEQWIDWQKLTHSEFARMCGCSREAVTRWATGSRSPSPKWQKVIERVTKGQVAIRLYDWMSERDKAYLMLYRQGLTIISAAKKLRIHRNTLANYLSGKSNTPDYIVQKIHKLAGLTHD